MKYGGHFNRPGTISQHIYCDLTHKSKFAFDFYIFDLKQCLISSLCDKVSYQPGKISKKE